MIKKYSILFIILSFLLGISLILFTASLSKNNENGRYKLYTTLEGQMIHILDTQTGNFKVYMLKSVYDKLNKGVPGKLKFILIDENGPSIDQKKLEELK